MCGKTFRIGFDSLANIYKSFSPCAALRDVARDQWNICDEDSIFNWFDDDMVFQSLSNGEWLGFFNVLC